MTCLVIISATIAAAAGVIAAFWRREERGEGGPPIDPEAWRRARLAYDAAYDAKHPEEWS